MSGRSSRADHVGDAVDMAGDDVAAEFVADLQRALEIEAGAARPAADGGDPQRLGGGIDREPGACRPAPVSTTVRQTPAQAIEAPIAIESRS